jgi:hypothetical protein
VDYVYTSRQKEIRFILKLVYFSASKFLFFIVVLDSSASTRSAGAARSSGHDLVLRRGLFANKA